MKKKLFGMLSVFCLLCVGFAYAQPIGYWDSNAVGGIFPANLSDKVGIGTTNPTQKLEVYNGDILLNDNTSGFGGKYNLTLKNNAQDSPPLMFCGAYSCYGLIYDSDNHAMRPVGAGRFAFAHGGISNSGIGFGATMSQSITSPALQGGVIVINADNMVNITNGGGNAISINNIQFTIPNRNVGIGTNSPTQKLDVNGNIRAADVCTTAGKCLSASINGSFWQSSNSSNTSGVNIYYNNGDVGIGTQTPSGGKLNINAKGYETGLYVSFVNGTGISVSSNANGRGIFSYSSSNKAIEGYSGSGTAGYFSTATGYGLIVASGNTGIGTTSPTEKLDVNGDVKIRTLSGNGTAYACIDSAGKLFRSATPCI